MLKNPFYHGQQRYKGQLWPHKYEPLISEQLFRKCEQVRLGHNKSIAKYQSKTFVLNKGTVRCADPKCGCAITAEIHKGRFIYYKCTNYHKVHAKSQLIPEKTLLEPIRHVLKNISLTPKEVDDLVSSLKNTEAAKNEFYTREMARLRNEHDLIQNRIEVMYTDRLDGRITTDEYDKKLKSSRPNKTSYFLKCGSTNTPMSIII